MIHDATMTLMPGLAPGATGSIALVGAGPGARDLLTFRAANRIAAADVICFDRLVDPDVLDLARPEAVRIFVGKEVGANAWPQERINALIVTAALGGARVVRLKSGDPSVFGRATEELEAARAAGIEVEIVPGVSAASAAAAALGRSLTERGNTDRLVLATGTCEPGQPDPDWGAMCRPGTVLALYMAVRKTAKVRASLLASGVPADAEVEVVGQASHPGQQTLSTTVDRMEQAISEAGVSNPAILLIRYPKARIGASAARIRPAQATA